MKEFHTQPDRFTGASGCEVLAIPRMETIKRTAELFGLPVHFVRAKVASGEIVAVRAGKRFLVNVNKFAEYLNTSTVTQDGQVGGVRAIRGRSNG